MADNVKGTQIYNLPEKAHIDYARGLQDIPPEVSESKSAAINDLTTLEPRQSDFSLLFGIPRDKSLAHFTPPEGLPTLTDLFSTSIAPSLGNEQSYKGWVEALRNLKELPEPAKNKLIPMFETLQLLSSYIRIVMANQGRYHKG